MRLKRLWIDGYKNINNFTMDFEAHDGLTLLIGNNGSGKSNILEAISAIFANLYEKSNKIAFSYKLDYEIKGKIVRINKNYALRGTYSIDGQTVTQIQLQEYLPSNIITIYSGEDLRLWTSFYERKYKKYLYDLKSGVVPLKINMIYINKYYWNLMLLIFAIGGNPRLNEFLRNKLNIQSIQNIKMFLNSNEIDRFQERNVLVKSLLDRINPQHENLITGDVNEFAEKLGCTNIFTDDNGISSWDLDYGLKELFLLFMQASMPKDYKVIRNIEITFNNILSLNSLSEGEKKLILVRGVLDIISDENSLILLDEPDAHIHESNKNSIFKLVCEYTKDIVGDGRRHVILTTHSPTLLDIADKNNVFMLRTSANGIVEQFESNKVEAIKYLTGSRVNVFSEKPVLLVEGKSDIIILEKVIKYFKNNEPEYSTVNLDFDMYAFGGTGNAKFLYDKFKLVFPERCIVVCFDNDSGGQSGANLFPDEVKYNRLRNQNFIKFNNDFFFLLPKNIEGIGDFSIEDYFSKGYLRNEIESLLADSAYKSYTSLPKIKQEIKENIGNKDTEFGPSELKRFKPLVDLLVSIYQNIQ